MAGLTRHGVPRLLRKANGKPHATNDDHQDSLQEPTPPASNQTPNGKSKDVLNKWQEDDSDTFRSPESSEDEAQEAAKAGSASNGGSGFKQPPTFDVAVAPKAAFKVPAASAPDAASKKRIYPEREWSSEDDGMVFSQPTPKRSRVQGSVASNIHLPPKPQTMYGGRKKSTTAAASRRRDSKKLEKTPQKAEPQRATFRRANVSEPEKPKAVFRSTRTEGDADSGASSPPLSSPLSSVASLEEVDMRAFNQSKPDPMLVECAICGAGVSRLLRQEFEDKHCKGRSLNYRLQDWFCQYHKVDTAKQEAERKGYPDIDWTNLDQRLERHHQHLLDVLRGRKASVYRTKLEKRVASGKAKSASALMSNKSKNKHDEFSPGYYGPRGEKLMTEHITRHFGDQLRKLSVTDPLIKASGLAGGVSGFVQAVLVPELAVALVKEDLQVDDKRAAAVLADSAEIGELLNVEEREKVDDLEDGAD